MELRNLNPGAPELKYLSRVNDEAFPPTERMSFEEMFCYAAVADTEVLGIYEQGRALGFVMILKNCACAFVILLALDGSVRSHGYGSAALHSIIKRYPDHQLVVDFEELDARAENSAQRLRRKNFYLRNGFHETGCFTVLGGERFEVLCTGGALKEEPLLDLIHVLHCREPRLYDGLLR